MTVEQFEDFERQIYWLVQEGGYLWEAPHGATDVLPAGDVVHGPWRQDDCAAVLAAWFEAGLLGLCTLAPDEARDLDGDTVRRVLSASDPWTPDWAMFVVFPTEPEDGTDDDFARWRALVPTNTFGR